MKTVSTNYSENGRKFQAESRLLRRRRCSNGSSETAGHSDCTTVVSEGRRKEVGFLRRRRCSNRAFENAAQPDQDTGKDEGGGGG